MTQRTASVTAQATQATNATKPHVATAQTKPAPIPTKSPRPVAKSPHSAGNHRTQAQKSPQLNAATRSPAGKGGARGAKGRTALSRASGELNLAPGEVVELFRRHASRPDVLDAIPAEDVATAFSAVVRGATIPGKEGNGDRSMLWRMLGLPWGAAGGAIGTRAEAAAFGAALGDRLIRAVNRHELHLSGRASVTVDIDADGNPASDRPSNGVGNRLLDHVPYQTPPDRAGAELRLDVPSQADPASTEEHPAVGRWQEPEAEVWGEEDEAAAR